MNTIFVLIFLLHNLSFPNLLLNRILLSCGYEITWHNSHSNLFVESQSTFDNVLMKLVAGTSTSGYSGDGDPATSAQIRSFISWVDNNGNIFLPDDTNRRIRKVSPTGIISTFGGTGSSSLAGVSGPIGSVNFWTPYSIVGNVGGTILYICDVRYVWKYEFSTGIAAPFAHSISLGAGFGGDDGAASSAQLSSPLGIWLTTAGVLYIADTDNQRIRKVSTGGIITTVAGSGPTGQNTGSYSGDNGLATAAKLKNPTSVYMDTNGNMFIADRDNGRIRKVAENNIITTFAGSGTLAPFNGENVPRLTANINLPADVKGDSLGNIYIADGGNCLVRIVDTQELIWTLFGLGIGSCGFTSAEVSSRGSKINSPNGIWLDSASNIYFSDYNSIHRSFVVSSPTSQPSRQPTRIPTDQPSNRPSTQPSSRPSLQTTYYFQFTGFIQNLTVPSYFNSMTVDITGAAGGSFTGSPGCNGGCPAGTRGFGARVQSTLPVTPGSILHIYVGGQGGASLGLPGTGGDGGWNGGGRGNVQGQNGQSPPYTAGTAGGGASDIRVDGIDYSHRIIVAGGGGGYYVGQNCGTQKGGDAGRTGNSGTTGCNPVTAAGGGTSTAGGVGGFGDTWGPAGAGLLGTGGNAAYSGDGYGSAGGGGGYYGGGGGVSGGSGGGGSSFSLDPLATFSTGYQIGGGTVTITFMSAPSSQPSSRPTRLPSTQPSGRPSSRPSEPGPSPNLFMKVIAGSGSPGYSGDQNPATSAKVCARLPWVDSSGFVYIADAENYRIRRVDPTSGIITTFGGTGHSAGDGISGNILTTRILCILTA
jgi:sugar lactone lactonase YvrE